MRSMRCSPIPRNILLTWLVGLLCPLLAWPVPGERVEQPPTDELIRRLGSKIFAQREEAARLLLQREQDAAALRAALKAADLETARRISLILEEFAERARQRTLARLPGLAER